MMQDSSDRKISLGRENDANAPGIAQADRPLPHSLKFEKAVLGAILVDESCLDEAIERFGSAKVFYNPANQKIYDTILSLHNKSVSIDYMTVGKALEDQGILEQVGGDAYLAEIQSSVATTAHMESWCSTVYEYAVLRELINSCTQAISACYDTEKEIPQILDEVETSILKARDLGAKQSFKDFKTLVSDAFFYMEQLARKDEEITGISTGFPGFDEKITGMKKGEMIVVAARPSVGKTSFALNIVSNVALRRAERQFSVAIFTMEMTAEQIARRLLCAEAGVSEKDILTNGLKGGDFSKLTRAASTLGKVKLYVDPTPSLRVMELRAKARRLKKRFKIDLLVIDYLQLMRADIISKSETRQIEVSLISSGIKSLAKELEIPILVLAQLNRAAEQHRDGIPRLSNLRESGAIEQDADIVAFLHRDTEAHRSASEEDKNKGLDAMLIIAKNRNGETGYEDLLFFPKTMTFKSKVKYGSSEATLR
ncbi:MAG: replicative DNA helicase [Candidatus Nanoarchaeia archaeon]